MNARIYKARFETSKRAFPFAHQGIRQTQSKYILLQGKSFEALSFYGTIVLVRIPPKGRLSEAIKDAEPENRLVQDFGVSKRSCSRLSGCGCVDGLGHYRERTVEPHKCDGRDVAIITKFQRRGFICAGFRRFNRVWSGRLGTGRRLDGGVLFNAKILGGVLWNFVLCIIGVCVIPSLPFVV